MNCYKKVSVFFLRNEKPLSYVLYGALFGLCLFAIYDPGTFIHVFMPGFLGQSDATPTKRQPGARTALSAEELEQYLPIYFRFTTTPRVLPHLRAVDIPFVPTEHVCDDMFERARHNFSYSEFYWEHMDAYKSALSMTGMMQEANVNEQSWAFHELARVDFVNNVCETGFHAGHNTFQWLTAKPEVTVYSFEQNNNNFTEDIAIFLSAEFPEHFYIHRGDTAKTIPTFQATHNKTKCDIVYVDSSKNESTMRQDIELFRAMVNPAENLFVMDAHGDVEQSVAHRVWRDLVHKNVIKDYYHCAFQNGGDMLSTRSHNVSGFFVGSFIIKNQ